MKAAFKAGTNSESVNATAVDSTADTPIAGAPRTLTSFVGRLREIQQIRRTLSTTRLLTLTGAGGSGKTRLALEVATQELRESPVPAAWVELAAVRDASLLLELVLNALGVRDEADAPSVERVARVIGNRPFLLVLDNGEHLVEACAALADGLLRQAPMLRIMVTSREALGVAGETAWLVPPLSLPAAGHHGALADSEAVQLFVQRAAAVAPGFTLTAENTEAVVQICRRLDGLPLALELAAVRLRTLGARQVAERLDHRFRLLTTGNRAALPRHQTLRAAIDWSYELLDARERLMLARLAVFGGSFALDGVESICIGDGLEPDDVLDVLSSLVEKSLVNMVESDGDARYRLLETVREYAMVHLTNAGDVDARLRRHAEYFVAFVQEAEPYLRTNRRPLWLPRIQAELENIRHALAWTRTNDEPLHVRLVGLMHWFWFSSGQWPEARQWLRGALVMTAAEGRTRERALLLFSSGGLAALQAMCESSVPQLEEAESIAAELGEERLLADVRNYLAMSFNALRDPRSEEVVMRARPWMRASGDLYALRLNYLLQGTARFIEGDVAGAIEATEEGVRAARTFGLDRELAIALQQLAMMVLRSGDAARAAALLGESLESLRRDPQLLFTCRALEYMASSAVSVAPADAARLYGHGDEIRSAIGARMWSVDELLHRPLMDSARTAIGATAFDEARQQGRALSLSDAIDLALLLSARMRDPKQHEPSRETSEFEILALSSSSHGETAIAVPALHVRTLGGLQIEREGGTAASGTFGHAKAREMLVYLLVHPDGRTREQVGAALWPEASAAQVRNNFHVALHHLRRALGGPEWVTLNRERYRLTAPVAVQIDALEFEGAITRALRAFRASPDPTAVESLADALSMYRGAFLDGEAAADWHLDVSDRLARLHADGLETLGQVLLQHESYDEAAAVFDRLVSQERVDESAYRLLMTARARSGDRSGAVREFRRLEGVLRREEMGEPSRETTALVARIERGEVV